MLLLEPGHTPYDLHFRVVGIPVRVHPMFWLVGAIMGFPTLNRDNGLTMFAIWMICMFVSILIHEMGHVIMGQLCGSSGYIVLYAFGGLAIPDRRLDDRWQRIAVSFAGPLAQFLLLGLLALGVALMGLDYLQAFVQLVLSFFSGPRLYDVTPLLLLDPLVLEVIFDLIVINLFWALLNLLPIWPLDGGQIARELLDGAMPGGQGVRVSLILSLVVAAVLTIHAIVSARSNIRLIPFLPPLGIYSALMFGMLGIQSFQLLQQESSPPWRREDW